MVAQQRRTTNLPCKKLHELPPVLSEWQQTTWCPDCDYYASGTCGNPTRPDGNPACPFDGKALPLREGTLDVRSSAHRNEIELDLQVIVCPATSEPVARQSLAARKP